MRYIDIDMLVFFEDVMDIIWIFDDICLFFWGGSRSFLVKDSSCQCPIGTGRGNIFLIHIVWDKCVELIQFLFGKLDS